METYVMTTGTVFGLLTLTHVGRMIEEGAHLATEPWYALVTVAASARCVGHKGYVGAGGVRDGTGSPIV